MLRDFKLIKKTKLTQEIYEMTFETADENIMKPGQFITFILDKIGGRAYSILELDKTQIKLIIKKRETENGGRGGSKFICELDVGENLKGVGPSGHFLLHENSKNKLFIGTGTGFVPLYNQIKGSLETKQNTKLKFIFGVRSKNDLFYEQELENMKKNNSNFDYDICLSRDSVEGYHNGYTIDLINENTVNEFEEYYICGAPYMIDSVVEKLKNLGVNDDCIYFEKY